MDVDTSIGSMNTNTSLISQEIFHPLYIFAPRETVQNVIETFVSSSHTHAHVDYQEVTVTGSADPFCLRVAYSQHVPGQQEFITLEVTCCNITNLPMSDFE
jgi:hypothetical protein